MKRGGNCGGSLIAGRVAGSDVSLGRGGILFEFDNFIPGGRRLVIDERSEFDRWIRLGTILFFFFKGGGEVVLCSTRGVK